jgi:exodeoxyribonuclease VII large subunit
MSDVILEQNNEIISVGELNNAARKLLESNFNDVSVIGEISNLSRPSSGHIYFTLKDDNGAIRCAMFRNANMRLKFNPKNGDKCILRGQVSIYAARGDYQLIARSMRLAGAGDLMQQFENLKEKLDSEGLFDLANKKILPKYPKHICIITSASTAAYQDIFSTIKRRSVFAKVSLSEAVVQGDSAHNSLYQAIERIEKFNLKSENPIDVVIISRGGGSIEDLWCFNNEQLARKIYNFNVPIISGVGHEIDFTITDFVADMRAPTPTAAAEIVTEGYFKLNDQLINHKKNLIKTYVLLINEKAKQVVLVRSKLKSPLSLLREKIQKLDNIEINLKKSIASFVFNEKQQLRYQAKLLQQNNPLEKIKNLNLKINSLNILSNTRIKNLLAKNRINLEKVNENLQILNPLAILKRGYSIIHNKDGNVIKSNAQININEELTARFGEGNAVIKVKKIND